MASNRARLPGVVARDLSPELQRRVWTHIKATNPAMATALSMDPFIARLRAEMGASPVLSEQLVQEVKHVKT